MSIRWSAKICNNFRNLCGRGCDPPLATAAPNRPMNEIRNSRGVTWTGGGVFVHLRVLGREPRVLVAELLRGRGRGARGMGARAGGGRRLHRRSPTLARKPTDHLTTHARTTTRARGSAVAPLPFRWWGFVYANAVLVLIRSVFMIDIVTHLWLMLFDRLKFEIVL